MPVQKSCKWCKEKDPKHFPFQCRQNPKIIARMSATPKPRKAIKKVGKVTSTWQAYRKEWFKLNPPTHNGKYECYLKTTLLCPRFMLPEETTLDHVIPKGGLKGRNLRYNEDNIKPACYPCNSDKGSMSLENYLKKYKQST